jgi:hypothetical protein
MLARRFYSQGKIPDGITPIAAAPSAQGIRDWDEDPASAKAGSRDVQDRGRRDRSDGKGRKTEERGKGAADGRRAAGRTFSGERSSYVASRETNGFAQKQQVTRTALSDACISST